ncbi:hypothetical protein [Halococcus thailandensis]|uniref:Uncharacterized protein n=1 Tax=Halococcus thailandensis JCM 13552 TaxID=1227457 RepID=M0NHM0_9EURY|nr:hypothetical protein [Halococcus thailandensis]EMA56150.1 hypothetical protein C451_03909 [Halococcus thailandensis JCM 13552]
MTASRTTLPRPYILASLATLVLTVIATIVGLFVPGFYRDAPVLLPQVYGQDLLTLVVAVPALAVSLYFTVDGSLRGYIVWLGVTGYLLYTYASYAFMTAFNELYLVYVALLGLTLYTFVGGMVRLNPTGLKRAVGERSVRSYVAFQLLVALLVVTLWLADILPATLAGITPESVTAANLPTNVIYSLDLGVLVPAYVISAYWLGKRRAWGYVFTGVVLAKIATLGLAVLSMVVVMVADGQSVVLPQVVIFGLISAVGLWLLIRFLRSVESGPAAWTAGASSGLTGK